MKFLLKNYNIFIRIRRIIMLFKIFLYHIIRYISRTPYTVSHCTKMTSPISFTRFRIFFLKSFRCTTLPLFNYIFNTLRLDGILCRNIYNLYLLRPFEFYNDTLLQKKMVEKYRNRLTISPLFFYKSKSIKCVATESLELKVHNFN